MNPSAPSRAQTVPEMRQAIRQAERGIAEVLGRLSQQLPDGVAVSGAGVDVLNADTVGGGVNRIFEAHISVEVLG